MANKKVVKWLSNRTCDFCHKECDKDLYDAVTVYGPWATMCKSCFEKNSNGLLGTGYGQHYVRNENNEFIKVEG